jgi:hypothetical protein
MVVSGRRMNVFVSDATSPTLEVGRLEGDAMKGSLRLQGPGTFANLVITPDAVDGLSREPSKDPLDGAPAWSGIGVSQPFPRCRTVRTPCMTTCQVSGTGW